MKTGRLVAQFAVNPRHTGNYGEVQPGDMRIVRTEERTAPHEHFGVARDLVLERASVDALGGLCWQKCDPSKAADDLLRWVYNLADPPARGVGSFDVGESVSQFARAATASAEAMAKISARSD